MPPNPKTMISPRGLVPTAYKLVTKCQTCQGCGRKHTQSEMMAMVKHPRISASANPFLFLPIRDRREIEYNLPVRVEAGPASTTPFCHECWSPGMLNNLPAPRPFDSNDTARKLQAMGLMAKEPQETRHFTKAGRERETWSRETVDKKQAKPKKPADKPFTVDDL